ncbi:hypothetical protein SETIT_9G303000v2 [Setaria italica]|uniref:Uncharacterized protein n=1 Tax=Setaria italica TaxID=4555 RepID=A0A368SMA1_SETIT|nr:hypothetical protein SETIT_9G303000v2 [Setaria italica]
MTNDKFNEPKVVKVDCSTSCDDLIEKVDSSTHCNLVNPPMKPSSCEACKGKSVEVKSCDLKTSNVNDELMKENELAMREIKDLKQQVIDLKSGYITLTNSCRFSCKPTRVDLKLPRFHIVPSVGKMVTLLLIARLHVTP